jgi:hypothetical protein
MQLARMQDIGGCRAVVKDLEAVFALAKKFDCPFTDYIATPKLDGYRGIHLISKYQPTAERNEFLAGRLTEIQIRTRRQHAWATAVETVDSLLNQKLKIGGGDEHWRRFFALSSSLLALSEKSPLVPGADAGFEKISKEIKDIDRRMRVWDRLTGLSASVVKMDKTSLFKDIGAYLLLLDLDKKTIQNIHFRKRDIQDSLDEYLSLEKRYYDDPGKQVVHVYVSKLKDLKRAYPNYFLDVSRFMGLMKGILK